jgi:hypothetical protein
MHVVKCMAKLASSLEEGPPEILSLAACIGANTRARVRWLRAKAVFYVGPKWLMSQVQKQHRFCAQNRGHRTEVVGFPSTQRRVVDVVPEPTNVQWCRQRCEQNAWLKQRKQCAILRVPAYNDHQKSADPRAPHHRGVGAAAVGCEG